MALEKVGLWNDLSPILRQKLEDQVESFGKKVRFKFDISNPDPDPEKKGEKMYPFKYTLDPITFDIIDKYEDKSIKGREYAQKGKKIGIVEETNERGNPVKFRRIRVEEMEQGKVTFDLEKLEDIENVMYLLLHPKLEDGDFADKTKRPIISRVDEKRTATEAITLRTARKKAMDIAEEMSETDIVNFADAMQWDSAQDEDVLRNKVEELAEISPDFFNYLVNSKKIEYQSAIKQANDKGIISYDPADGSIKWTSNNQPITSVSVITDKSWITLFSEWMQSGGKKEKEVYTKIKSLTSSKSPVEV